MAKNIPFQFGDISFESSITKIDRDKLYGKVVKRYSDGNQPIQSEEDLIKLQEDHQNVYLLDDNRTMYGTGGASLKVFDTKGDEVSRTILVARNEDGSEAEKFPSSFDKVNQLDTTKGLEEYLSMDVKAVYQLDINDDKVLQLLQQHKVLYFEFNYRAGYSTDDAFLISRTIKDKETKEQSTHFFAVTGKINDYEYCTFGEPAVQVTEVPEEAEDDDDMFEF